MRQSGSEARAVARQFELSGLAVHVIESAERPVGAAGGPARPELRPEAEGRVPDRGRPSVRPEERLEADGGQIADCRRRTRFHLHRDRGPFERSGIGHQRYEIREETALLADDDAFEPAGLFICGPDVDDELYLPASGRDV